MTDPELLAKYPFLPVIATSFEHGDGDFRPRIPQYPELQDLIGGAILSYERDRNSALFARDHFY